MQVELPALPYLFMRIAPTLSIPQQKNRSEFTGRTQTIGLPGAEQWLATAYAIPAANLAEMFAWHAFLAACRGSENTFNLPARALRQSSAANPTVTAAVAGNRAVTVSSAANVQLGMYATVLQSDGHARLVKVVGKNGLDVHFEPYLTTNPTIGEELVIDQPYSRMQLAKPDQPLPEIGEYFSFDCEENL
jgi:hypothetical protein